MTPGSKAASPQEPESFRVVRRRLYALTRVRIIIVIAGGVIAAIVLDALDIQPLVLRAVLMATVASLLGAAALILAERMLDSLLEPLNDLWRGTTVLGRGEYKHRIQ